MTAHLCVLLLHIARCGFQYKAADLEIREAGNLRLFKQTLGKRLQVVVFLQVMLDVNDMLQSLKEPYVNLCKFFYALHAISFLKSLRNGKDTKVGRILQLVVEILKRGVVVAHESVHALPDHSQAFLYHLLKRTSDGHDFAYRLHRRTYQTAYSGKLGKVPAGYLAYHVVELRGYIGRVWSAHLAYLVEGVAQCYFCCHEGKRIAGGL